MAKKVEPTLELVMAYDAGREQGAREMAELAEKLFALNYHKDYKSAADFLIQSWRTNYSGKGDK